MFLLLFWCFQENMCTGEAFSSIPDAMFYTAVFLGGEWSEVDFTWAGKVLCCVLCVFGIVLFGIPVRDKMNRLIFRDYAHFELLFVCRRRVRQACGVDFARENIHWQLLLVCRMRLGSSVEST